MAICPLVPWSHQVIAVDVLGLSYSPAGRSDIWAVQLASGRRCVASGGADDRIGNDVEQYFCGPGVC